MRLRIKHDVLVDHYHWRESQSGTMFSLRALVSIVHAHALVCFVSSPEPKAHKVS